MVWLPDSEKTFENMISRFDTIHDRHRATAEAALMHSIKRQKMRKTTLSRPVVNNGCFHKLDWIEPDLF